jgi:hypothetical protein
MFFENGFCNDGTHFAGAERILKTVDQMSVPRSSIYDIAPNRTSGFVCGTTFPIYDKAVLRQSASDLNINFPEARFGTSDEPFHRFPFFLGTLSL